ncbi:peptide-methionine (S)-S-oxide reductase MsrA [Phycicoccus sp. BSK3Z-2]|uniref:Peptide methionine sulfoxide reductase MsrA n=1 Tax=Phycicoccus avicenniae TaxID=2828860 RepID=A0A941I042_9MICO|nr:peptide-methionine (S)-S-oxide reductase MsrA [Phycicoccus avicenniae]MBR7743662.1 peptide-methionine (S)-S-oxide reductase MsrA [Phycicoccus avicenniae]
MLFGSRARTTLPSREDALPGRDHRIFPVPVGHEVLGTPLEGPWPDGTRVIYVAMGCFWGVERIFWQLPGVVTTAAGYMGGFTPNPTYEETCTGRTGHAEAVLVAYDPERTSPDLLLKAFWENHDPTQGNRQGNDVGTAYRSAIWTTTADQAEAAERTRTAFQQVLTGAGRGGITTTIASADEGGPFWYAEDYHQQYLHKNPAGYCNHGPNGFTCPVGVADLPAQTDVVPPSPDVPHPRFDV